MTEFYEQVRQLKYLGIEHSNNVHQPPFILEHSVRTGYYKYVIVDRENIFFFQILWDELDRTNLYTREIIFFRDNTVYCRDDIIIYFKKERNVFFVTSKNIECLVGEYHIKGEDKGSTPSTRRKREFENKKKMRKRYEFEKKNESVKEEMVYFRFYDEEKVFGIPTRIALKVPFLQHVIFQDFMKKEKKKEIQLELNEIKEDIGVKDTESEIESRERRKRDVIVLMKSDHFTEKSIQLAIEMVEGKKNMTQTFFEDFSSKNISQKIYHCVNGYRNCSIVVLSDQRVFFYYREGLRKLKILKIMEYDVVGGVEIYTRIGNILFFHDKCKLFLNTKYRKHISIKEMKSSKFRSKTKKMVSFSVGD